MSESKARDLGMKVLKGMAQVVGGILAVFGGGCVVIGTIVALSDGSWEILGIVLVAGVLPLVVGLALSRWGGMRFK